MIASASARQWLLKFSLCRGHWQREVLLTSSLLGPDYLVTLLQISR